MKREKGTLYSLVTRYYIFFAAAVLLLSFIIVNLTGRVITQMELAPGVSRFISNDSLIRAEKYDKLNIRKYLGEKSYFEVLDENANVIYTSDDSKNNVYTLEELEFIPQESGDTYYYLENVFDDKGNITGYLHNKYSLIKQEDGDYYGLTGTVSLDADRNVVFADYGIGFDRISKKEFDIIYGNEEETYLQKYEYTTNSGKHRTMLLHQNFNNSSLNSEYRRVYMTAILSFLLIFAIFVILFVFHTSLAVRKPITMLQDAMKELGSGNKDIAITYSGPKEFVRIVDSFNDMTGKLYEAEQEKDKLEKERQKMIADISHDLKTPITVIQGYSRAVADGMVPDNEKEKYLNTISRKADNLAELIDTFSEYSKLEHPEFKLYKKDCDICEYLREYLADKYSELDIAGYSMEIDIPEEKIVKCIDTSQLKRVFENIISNSVKSNPAGTLIYAGMKRDGDKVIIRLGDDGNGIPGAIKDDIFNPFVVGDEARTSGRGTGLGLSIAKLIVEAHGGTIRLLEKDETTYSTVFEIVL